MFETAIVFDQSERAESYLHYNKNIKHTAVINMIKFESFSDNIIFNYSHGVLVTVTFENVHVA